ncbi:hypothetical protein [Velocimicrobium porci]|uniref:Uncharacterized protein n=1 Tax=Velocimicrobium porci TaxID=2606634 RepID=A0A6L5XUG8_9FIRM|nr:hypothetical protein [Velocimicrobium porci]MSS62456.1 hypothetical protein [Velocimicrobium porci]
MVWRKREEESELNQDIISMIGRCNIPILVLDERWHELFPEYKKTQKIKELEKNLNRLIKYQGKINDDKKEMKKLKHRLMEEIISNMGESTGEAGLLKQKKQEKSQRLIKEINVKLAQSEDEENLLPYKIKKANEELLIESLKIWYQELDSNREEIKALTEWIADAREKLKVNILKKQDMEMENNSIYSYMHSLLGAGVMQALDEDLDR